MPPSSGPPLRSEALAAAQQPYGAPYRWTTTNRFGGQSWLPRRAIERALATVTLAASGATLFMQIATNVVAIASDARARRFLDDLQRSRPPLQAVPRARPRRPARAQQGGDSRQGSARSGGVADTCSDINVALMDTTPQDGEEGATKAD
jgi:hypothetical protein